MEAGYRDNFGPPSWVAGHIPSPTLSNMVQAQPTSEEHQEAEDLEKLVVSLDLPSVEAMKDRGALTLTSASIVAILPAEDLVAREALAPKLLNITKINR